MRDSVAKTQKETKGIIYITKLLVLDRLRRANDYECSVRM